MSRDSNWRSNSKGAHFSRRRVMSTTAGLALAGAVGSASTVSAAAHDVEIEYTGLGVGATSTGDNNVRSSMSIDIAVSGELDLGGDTETAIRVHNLTAGTDLTVVPEGDRLENVESIDLQNLYNRGGELYPDGDRDLQIRVAGEEAPIEEVPHEVDGDEDTFIGEETFSSYRVELIESVDDPTTIAATDDQTFAIGFDRPPIEQSGTTGEVELTLTLPDPVDESWYVEFGPSLGADEGFDVDTAEVPNDGGSVLEWTVDLTDSEPGEYDGWQVEIYPSESETSTSDGILRMFGYFAIDDDYIVVEEGPVDEPGQEIRTAEREIDATTVPAGESTEVTVTAELNEETEDLRIVETFEPAEFAEISILDDSGATISQVTDDSDELAASWGGVEDVTITYEVAIPEDAEDGETVELSGTVEDEVAGLEETIGGDDTIEVGEVDDPVAEYADPDTGEVDANGMLEAAADFRDGEADTNTLLDVAAAFRSGAPVF